MTIESVELPDGTWSHRIEFDSTVLSEYHRAHWLLNEMTNCRWTKSSDGWIITGESSRYGTVVMIDRVGRDRLAGKDRVEFRNHGPLPRTEAS